MLSTPWLGGTRRPPLRDSVPEPVPGGRALASPEAVDTRSKVSAISDESTQVDNPQSDTISISLVLESRALFGPGAIAALGFSRVSIFTQSTEGAACPKPWLVGFLIEPMNCFRMLSGILRQGVCRDRFTVHPRSDWRGVRGVRPACVRWSVRRPGPPWVYRPPSNRQHVGVGLVRYL